MEEIDSDDDRLFYITDNPDQVRRKIRAFLNAGEMKVGEFQRALGVSSNAYARFMGQNGPTKGMGCDTYMEAFKFFKRRELMGIKIPRKKVKALKGESATANTAAVDTITLDGEENLSVPVYDSCDEIRRKIRAYLMQPNVTQAGFLREIAKTYGDGRKIQSKVLNDFLGKRGEMAGNTSAVYYGSYVFFEKMRIRDGKPESKHRMDMKARYRGGIDTKHRRDNVWITTKIR